MKNFTKISNGVNKKISPKVISLIFGILVICFVVGFYVFAWAEPQQVPPNCTSGQPGCDAPINVGHTGQYKSGSLRVAGLTVDSSTYLATTSGNVGIGTMSPLGKLDIQGGADSTGANDPYALLLQYRSGGYRHRITTRHNSGAATGNDIDFYLWNYGVDAAGAVGTKHVMTLEGTGNVGIGTTTPQEKLEIKDGGIFINAKKQFGGIYPNNFDYNNAISFVGTGWHDGLQIFSQDPGPGQNTYCGDVYSCVIFNMVDRNVPPANSNILFGETIGTTGVFTPIMAIRGDTRNVGIGTVSPGAKLEVAGQVKITGGTPGAGKALISDAAGLASWGTITGTLPAGASGQTLRHDGTTWVASNNLFNNGTNVGIGTTTPVTTLSVNGGESPVQIRRIGEKSLWIRNINFLTSLDSSGPLTFSTGASDTDPSSWGTERVRITTTGNVGIGTTTPNQKLEVITGEGVNTQLRLGKTAYSTEYYDIGRVDASGFLSIQGAQAGFNSILLAPTSGNVGIGTATPYSKLQVAGGVQIGNDTSTCNATKAGTLRYNAGNIQYCNGTSWLSALGGVSCTTIRNPAPPGGVATNTYCPTGYTAIAGECTGAVVNNNATIMDDSGGYFTASYLIPNRDTATGIHCGSPTLYITLRCCR